MLKTVSSITNAIGALNYKGTWNATTNTPTLVSSVGVKGDYYQVSVAGSTTINGISNWGVGDVIAFNGVVWQRIEGGADLNGVNLSVSGTTTLSGLTASTALALNAGKDVVSVTNTGTGNNVLADGPTLTTPTIGVATATSVNKVTITAPATGSTLTIADNKTLTANNSLTLAGTDATTMTFPNTSATVARTDAGQTFASGQIFQESLGVEYASGAPSTAQITRTIDAGWLAASARGSWAIADAFSGTTQYVSYKNGSNNDFLVWDLILENCTQIVCSLVFANANDAGNRTIVSEYSIDGGSAWVALGSSTTGSGDYAFGGTVNFSAPNKMIYFKLRIYYSASATSTDLIGVRDVKLTPTCTSAQWVKVLG
jgi:hypothetical protein